MMWRLIVIPILLLGLIGGYLVATYNIPPSIRMPVVDATRNSYDQKSFGAPRAGHTHKGVDIFAKRGTPVVSATAGLVVFTGYLKLGGKAVSILSPDLTFLYYAHLDTILSTKMSWVSAGDTIGRVGNTGNAKNTPAHLHFSICRVLPYKKFFDPVPLLNASFSVKQKSLASF